MTITHQPAMPQTLAQPVTHYRALAEWMEIDRVEVVRIAAGVATVEYPWLQGSGRVMQYRMNAEDSAIFPTWAEAHAWLLEKAQQKYNAAQRRLELAADDLGKVQGMLG